MPVQRTDSAPAPPRRSDSSPPATIIWDTTRSELWDYGSRGALRLKRAATWRKAPAQPRINAETGSPARDTRITVQRSRFEAMLRNANRAADELDRLSGKIENILTEVEINVADTDEDSDNDDAQAPAHEYGSAASPIYVAQDDGTQENPYYV